LINVTQKRLYGTYRIVPDRFFQSKHGIEWCEDNNHLENIKEYNNDNDNEKDNKENISVIYKKRGKKDDSVCHKNDNKNSFNEHTNVIDPEYVIMELFDNKEEKLYRKKIEKYNTKERKQSYRNKWN